MELKFIHSFSSNPLNINCYNLEEKNRICGIIWYFTASVLYLKKLGQKINLYTDERGKYLFKNIPYDNVHDIDIKEIHPRFWASAKFYAMQQEDLNAIHIDGDVFIKSDKILNRINNNEYDLLVQNYESGEWYETEDALFILDNFANDKFKLSERGAYNCGIIKFNNQQLKDDYINGYFELAKHYSECYDVFLNSANRLTPDLIIEQQRLYQMTKDYKVLELLENNTQVSAINLGYLHMLSHGKFNHINEVKQIVEKLDYNLYCKTIKHCKKLLINYDNN